MVSGDPGRTQAGHHQPPHIMGDNMVVPPFIFASLCLSNTVGVLHSMYELQQLLLQRELAGGQFRTGTIPVQYLV